MCCRTFGVLGSILLASVPALSAQAPAGNDEVDRQVQEMRRQMVEGKVIRSHVRVTVRLKNGNQIKGIVKDGFLVERVDGLHFVAAEANDPGAGIRVYYWNGTGSFVFLPFADVRDYRVNERLTSAQLAALEQEARQRDAAAKALEAAKTVAPPADGTGADGAPLPGEGETPPVQKPVGTAPPADGGKPAAVPPANGALSEEQKQLFALLQEYPPQAGWSQGKRDEIARRKVVIGVNPSVSEQRFIDHFADWQRACDLFGSKPAAPPPAAEPESGRKSRRK